MKVNYFPSVAASLVALAFSLSGLAKAADDELPDHKLSEWSLGTTIQGEAYTQEDLEGKVVVIEYWGTR